jgi:hypothetical protein
MCCKRRQKARKPFGCGPLNLVLVCFPTASAGSAVLVLHDAEHQSISPIHSGPFGTEHNNLYFLPAVTTAAVIRSQYCLPAKITYDNQVIFFQYHCKGLNTLGIDVHDSVDPR